jgi:cytochrome c biogenesis protein CcmG/thiol:disulfide interchange protein DsbE
VTSRRRLGRALAAPLLLALLAACNPSISPPSYRPPADRSLITAAALESCPATGSAVSGGLPHLTLHCLDDSGTVDLAGLKGPAVINVWSSSCLPCRTESPALERYRKAAKGRVLVLGIDIDPYPDDGLTFARNQGLHYPSVVDEHLQVQGKLKVATLPMSFFLDAEGHLVGNPQIQPFGSESEVAAAVKAHLGVTVP